MFFNRRSKKETDAGPESTQPEAATAQAPTDSAQAIVKRLQPLLNGSSEMAKFTEVLFQGADQQTLAAVSDGELASLVREVFSFHEYRRPEQHDVRVRPLMVEGAAPARSVIEIVNDDMPFLVDSVVGELRESGHGADLVLHPTIKVSRNPDGRRSEILGSGDERWVDAMQESIIVMVVDRLVEAEADDLMTRLNSLLGDVRVAVADWQPMLTRFKDAIAALESVPPNSDSDVIGETAAFCKWLIGDQFTFLGLREYRLEGDQETGQFVSIPGSELGVLRDPARHVLAKSGQQLELTPEIRKHVFTPEPLIITKSDIYSRIHRRGYMDYIGLKTYAADGRQTGELRVVGLLTSQAYTERPGHIPFLRLKVDNVMQRSGFAAGSHSGKALLSVLENFPRDELFRISEDMLLTWSRRILDLDMRPQVRVFARRDRFDRFVSALVYVPRDRYNSAVRGRIGDVLAEAWNGHVSAFDPFFPEGPLVRVHYIIGRNQNTDATTIDEAGLEARIDEMTRNWNDQLVVALKSDAPNLAGLTQKYVQAFSPAYSETFTVQRALQDITRIEKLGPDRPGAVDFVHDESIGEGLIRAIVYRFDEPIPLSERVPVLENFGFRSIDERSYRVEPRFADERRQVALHDMVLSVDEGEKIDLSEQGPKLEEGLMAVAGGLADSDPFNRLVLTANLEWRQIAMLRSYGAYLRQIGSPYGMRYIADTLVRYPHLARNLADLFTARFDPDAEGGQAERAKREDEIGERLEAALVEVPSLDEDRILRHYLNLIRATKRTNYFRREADGGLPATLSFKLASREVDGAPAPRPYREIWVYSPRVEGVHLRFGPIARGGLRWSDRAQDFRTEVLGLCKAQQVKNTVIVPDGSKGGFLPKQLPRGGDRDAFMAEGIAAYKLFVSSLIEITDNIVDGKIVPPDRVVRHEEDDPYLVVAADKGTATFSDFANEISVGRGFWLGDAFASGGSAGYDHKKMGITARGGWECVKRHFREMDIDIQTTPFTVIGVGDMSGDVFGNGMLLSRAIKLVAAFDHRDIFIDPDPDPETSFAERQRLFDMGRSTWQDYDKSKISAGGWCFSAVLEIDSGIRADA